MNKLTKFTSALAIGLVALCGQTMAADFDAVEAKLKSAMAAEGRPEGDVKRDRNRKPIQTLKFLGLRDNMKVVEIIPGGGWYTRLLAPVLEDKGELHLAYGADRALKIEGLNNLKNAAKNAKISFSSEGMGIADANINVKRADMVLTFRNYHNLSDSSRETMNKQAYKVLKKGGIYGVVDHTRRHMEPKNNENGRRFDPVLAIKEIQAAGFEFVDYSDLHYRSDDELRYEVGKKSVTGNSDRWTLKFKKK